MGDAREPMEDRGKKGLYNSKYRLGQQVCLKNNKSVVFRVIQITGGPKGFGVDPKVENSYLYTFRRNNDNEGLQTYEPDFENDFEALNINQDDSDNFQGKQNKFNVGDDVKFRMTVSIVGETEYSGKVVEVKSVYKEVGEYTGAAIFQYFYTVEYYGKYGHRMYKTYQKVISEDSEDLIV